MSKVTMESILADTQALIKQSQANFKKAGYAPAAMAGGDGSGMPGSENDKPINEGAKKPDAEVSQGLPAGTLQGGSSEAEKIEGGHATDVTQPEKSPSKEPMVTADANAEAKTGAAKAANDLLSSIHAYQVKAAGKTPAAVPAVKAAAAPAAVIDAPAATAVAPAPELKKESNKDAKTPEIKKSEAVQSIEMSQDILAKIASVILATEDGVKYAEETLVKVAGAEAARDTFEFLQKQAMFQAGANDAEALVLQMRKQAEAEYLQGQRDAEAKVTQAIQAEIQKQAAIAYKKGLAEGQVKKAGITPANLKKLAQDMADQSAAEAMPEAGAEAAPAEAMGEMGSAPQDQEISPEDLVAALQELVQEGSIQPEAAEAIMQALAGGGEGGEAGGEGAPAPEGMPAEGAGEEVPAPEEAPKAEEEDAAKAASMKTAQSLLAAIQSIKAANAKK